MRSTDLFGFFLLFFLDFWRPSEALCELENGTYVYCHYLEDAKYISTYDPHTLKAPTANRTINPDIFRNFSSLRHLDLSGGNVEDIKPGTFLRLPHLLTLNLAHNRIKNLHVNSFDGLKYLRGLSLQGNLIRELPQALNQLKNLRSLDVSKTPIQCDCKALQERNELIKRGVKILKEGLCAGSLTCLMDLEIEEMQMDQPAIDVAEGSGDVESSDVDELEDGEKKEVETVVEPSAEEVETPAPETPAPEIPKPKAFTSETSAVEASANRSVETMQTTHKPEITVTSVNPVEVSLEKNMAKGDDGLFFDSEDKTSTESLPILKTQTPDPTDELAYPATAEGSGSDDEFEGSGTRVPPIDYARTNNESEFENAGTAEEDESSNGNESLFDKLFGPWESEKSTTVSTVTPESDIEKEEFLPVTPNKASILEAGLQPKLIPKGSNTNSEVDDLSRVTVPGTDDTKAEMADASPTQEHKKGMGSYVVLAALLAILVILIGFAAYKGNFCKKKRVHDDPERGTELKSMQKALLETSNSVQPKISSNGNFENVPLMNTSSIPSESQESKIPNRNSIDFVDGIPSITSPDIMDPVKPPRKSIVPQEENGIPFLNGKSNQEPLLNSESKPRIGPIKFNSIELKTPPNTPITPMGTIGPPLSPSAQRVKIILQDNPDSVPKTPILITRTKAGENIVKTP